MRVSRETEARLDAFAKLVAKWNRSINLIAASTDADIRKRHIADSLQLVGLAPMARSWVDLGSGGGFPGMVIAIAMAEVTGSRVELVESNRKKAAFLMVARSQCASGCVVHPRRIEDALPMINKPDVVTARALAPLSDLLEWTEPWLAAGTTGLFPKGRDYAREVEDTSGSWSYDLVVHPSETDVDARILEVRSLRRKV